MLIINLILIYTIIQLGLSLFNNSTKSAATFGCGLVGFSGKTDFDEYKIKLLMLYNESRGEDSTGYYTDSMIKPEKSIQKATYFLQKPISPNKLFIGHTRAKTVGATSERNAHPFKFGDIIMAHNGSLKEYITLANKYEIAHLDYNVDSEIICAALNKYKDPRVLYDLEGAASVLFTNDAENGFDEEDSSTLYCFRKNYERPLYRGFTEEGIYVSSLEESLKAINCTDVIAFEPNTIYKLRNGVIVESRKLPDVKMEKKAVSVTTTTTSTNGDDFIAHIAYYEAVSSVYSHNFNISSGDIYKSSMIRKDNSAIKTFDNARKLATISTMHFRPLPINIKKICRLTEEIKGTEKGVNYYVPKDSFVFVDGFKNDIFEVTILPSGDAYEVSKEILRGLTSKEVEDGNKALNIYNTSVANVVNDSTKETVEQGACCNIESPFKDPETKSLRDKILNRVFEQEDDDDDDTLVPASNVQNFILEVSDMVDDVKERLRPDTGRNNKYLRVEELSSVNGILDDMTNGLLLYYDKLNQ